MIQEENRELLLEVKEMLSRDGGYYPESMAPLIGGKRPYHGSLEPVTTLIPLRIVEFETTNFKHKIEYVYELQHILIDNENTIRIYREYHLSSIEAERLLEVWAAEFKETTILGLIE